MTLAERELTCQEVASFLADYLAGELDAEDRSQFEAHLNACPECTVYLRTYADAIRLAKDAYVPPANVPERLVQAILAARQQR